MTDAGVRAAKKRLQARLKGQPREKFVRYDRPNARIVGGLTNGLELGVPVARARGLAGAKPFDLAKIQISPTGLGLHWPRLDADLYLPSLMAGVFGTRRWMAQLLGKAGGRSTSAAKQKAARPNGKLGGRSRKVAHA